MAVSYFGEIIYFISHAKVCLGINIPKVLCKKKWVDSSVRGTLYYMKSLNYVKLLHDEHLIMVNKILNRF